MSRSSIQEGFRQSAVCRTVGISYRQLDYWARTKLVVPTIQAASGSGSQRMYSFSDVVELRIIKKLLDAGVTLPKIRKAVTYLREDLNRPLRDVTLVSDGKTIHACISNDEVVDVLRSGQGVFAIALDKVHEELEGSISRIRGQEAADAAAEGDARSEAHGG